MNGIGQLFRALVMETVALVLLFWLAFYQLMPQIPGDSAPQPLVIRSAPERMEQATQTVRSTQEQIEAAARRCYETAFRVGRHATSRQAASRHQTGRLVTEEDSRLGNETDESASLPSAPPLRSEPLRYAPNRSVAVGNQWRRRTPNPHRLVGEQADEPISPGGPSLGQQPGGQLGAASSPAVSQGLAPPAFRAAPRGALSPTARPGRAPFKSTLDLRR